MSYVQARCDEPLVEGGPGQLPVPQPAMSYVHARCDEPLVEVGPGQLPVPQPAMSYVHARCDEPLVEAALGPLLDDIAAKWPQKEAYVFKQQGIRVTLGELKQEADRLAAGLLAIGVNRGDVIAFSLGTRPEWIYVCYAAAKIGAIVMPIPPYLLWSAPKEELFLLLNKVQVKVLIAENRPATESFKGAIHFLNEVFPETISAKTGTLAIEMVPSLESIVLLGGETPGNTFYNFEEIRTTGAEDTKRKRMEGAQRQTNSHDVFALFFTTGSTGRPKGVEHSSFNLFNNTRFAGKDLDLDEKKVLDPMDMNEFGRTCLLPLTSGCTVVYPSNGSPTQADIISALLEERCEACMVFFVKKFQDFVNDPTLKELDTSFLKRVRVSGNVVSNILLQRAAEVLPHTAILNAYGISETLVLATASSEMTKEQLESTVGKLYPHMEMKLVDKDGQTVPLQQEGEVWVRGYSVFSRYRGDEEKTAEAKTADGWYKTGDVGILDENGFLKITGRMKDIIAKNLATFHPSLVENVLLKHPKVLNVKVVGVPDPVCVEEICACIILKKGQSTTHQDMKTYSLENWLVEEACPGYFVFMENFPVIGRKVDRKRLRAVAMETLGLQENAE